MNAIACPSVGSRMSPRGSFGFGSIANLMSYPWSMTYSDSRFSPSAYRSSADPDVLGGAGLRALAAAPEDVGLRAELGGQVQVAHHLGEREPADLALVRGERAVLEDRVAEQVRGGRGHHQPGLVQRLAERGDLLVPLGVASRRSRTRRCRGSSPRRRRAPRACGPPGRPPSAAAPAPPNTSTPCQPTVQIPNENLSSRSAHTRLMSWSTFPSNTPEPSKSLAHATRALVLWSSHCAAQATAQLSAAAVHETGGSSMVSTPSARAALAFAAGVTRSGSASVFFA